MSTLFIVNSLLTLFVIGVGLKVVVPLFFKSKYEKSLLEEEIKLGQSILEANPSEEMLQKMYEAHPVTRRYVALALEHQRWAKK